MRKHEVLNLGVDQLVPYDRNSRLHGPGQIAQLAASIKEFGFTSPVIVDETNTILAGEGRVQAARHLGLQTVPCIVVNDLTKDQKAAYVIADNRIALTSEWDEAVLAEELARLTEIGFDLSATGFSDFDLQKLADDLQVVPLPDDTFRPPAVAPASVAVRHPITRPMQLPPAKDWSGMPEFEQEDLRPFKTVLLHFEDAAAIEHFNNWTQYGQQRKCQPITEKTKYLWWPERVTLTHKGVTYE